MQIVVQIPLLERLPFVLVQPNNFTALAMVERKRKPVANQILDHAKAAFGTVDIFARFREHQVRLCKSSLGQIWAVLLEPLPIFASLNPVALTLRAPKR